MKFEKNYFEEYRKMMRKADYESQKSNGFMTEEERIAAKKRSEKDFQRVLERYERECQRNRRVTNQAKAKYFEKIAEVGKVLAEKIDADISIKSDGEHGEIWLKVGLTMFGTLNETVSIPQLSWGNNRCKWR